MEVELGRKYKNKSHEVNASLSDPQQRDLKEKYNISSNEFAELYLDFTRMEPTGHLKSAMDAFTASGGNVDIEPAYDEESGRLKVAVKFVIKDQVLDKIEGLSELEDIFLKVNAMIQVETVLDGSDPSVSPSF
jgi:hypothetical protein